MFNCRAGGIMMKKQRKDIYEMPIMDVIEIFEGEVIATSLGSGDNLDLDNIGSENTSGADELE